MGNGGAEANAFESEREDDGVDFEELLTLEIPRPEDASQCFFWYSKNSPFSQWYASPFYVNEQRYPTAERYMMAQKARLFGDPHSHRLLLSAGTSAKQSKAIGRKIANFDEATWCDHRERIVLIGNYYKFMQNEDLAKQLLDTEGIYLAEAAPNERVWGVGVSTTQAKRVPVAKWSGLNLLGTTLMRVRYALSRRRI